MEKKTMETLRTMICGEIEDIAKKGTLSHETLDILKDLLESEKNLAKIEKYAKEKEKEEMDMGYSQRKYYIDADYNPGQPINSYARGGRGGYGMDTYGMGNSYAMNTNYGSGANYARGNSYMYDPMYSMAPQSQGGYSMGGSKSEMIHELTQMMNEAPDDATKKAIALTIEKLK